ncbi:P-loop containing nucleoside triphosphate hydrolase protein, partial [Diaporthe sp. PMI_573]
MEDEFKKTTDKIRPYLSILVFALRKSQVWRREILNQLPPCIENDIAIDTELDTETTSARQHYISHVRTLIKKELKRCTKEWKKDKEFAESKGEPFHQPEPTYFDIAQRAAGGHDKNAGYLDLTRMSTFPYIAVLQKSGTITRAELGSTECQKIAVDVQKLIEGNKEISHSSLLKEFADWDFHKCRHQLFDNSPKFQLLLQLIEDLLKDIDSRTAPEDKSGKRHAIVFATHNITAILIYYLLVTNAELCKDIEPILLTSSMPMPKRRQWVNYMGQPCTPESRCKILIAVTEIAAEGFNLQRVNNVWFIELPNTLTKLHQAIGRAHRTKQKSRVKIVKMYDKLNLLDKYAFNAMKSKRELADRLYNVKVVWS